MKNFVMPALAALLTAMTFAAPIASQAASQEENFKACAASDSSWMSRWGNYVVSFDRSGAEATCRSQSWGPYEVRQTGCYLNGSWAKAGYYCQEVNGG